MEKIAVFMNQDRGMANFYDCDYIMVIAQKLEALETERVMTFDRIMPEKPIQIRNDVQKIVEMIKDCEVVAFKEISGIPYSVFDSKGFYIFSVPDYADETLKGIFSELDAFQKTRDKQEEMIKNARPVETENPGIYYFDLQKVQELCPEISSKKALKQFLETTPFMELKLVCAHIPPWLKQDERFMVKAEEHKDCVNAIVTHRQC
jgi:hypothetical protein